MTISIFFIEQSDLNENPSQATHLGSLMKTEIDLGKAATQGNAIKHHHLQASFLEFVAGDMVFEGTYSQYFEEILMFLHQTDPELAGEIRLGATVFPHESLIDHLDGFIKLAEQANMSGHSDIRDRIESIKKAINQGCSILEIADPVVTVSDEDVSPVDIFEIIADTGITQPKHGGRGNQAYENIVTAISQKQDGQDTNVVLGELSHIAITQALRETIYRKDKSDQSIVIPVLYSDGSQARPLVFNSLDEPDPADLIELDRANLIHTGMISARHPEMDTQIGMYWFRNHIVSDNRCGAETDELAYLETKEKLKLLPSHPVQIAFYQTGFQPVVIGFYRAIAEEILARSGNSPSLRIIPYFYDARSGENREGIPWH